MLQNEEVCGNTIYSSSEASGVNDIIHRFIDSLIIISYLVANNNISYLVANNNISYLVANNNISYLVANNNISYQVEMVRYSHNCFVIWRPRDTISAQTMARHQSRV